MEIFWRIEALEHLEDIREYIAQDNPEKALEVWECIYLYAENLFTITEKPSLEIGRPGIVKGTRELVVAHYPNYIITYRIRRNDRVEILAVRHGKQLPPKTYSET